MKTIALISRLIVGGILLYAGFMKAVGPSAEFAAMIVAYKVIPASLATPLAVALPYIEMWTGIFIFCGFYVRYASSVAMVLFGIFILALASTLIRGIDLASCGCFGTDTLSPHYTVIMDIVLFGLSWLLRKESKIPSPHSLDGINF